MAELKTQRTGASVPAFLAAVADPQRRADAEAACTLMTEATGVTPAMWGTSIVGFGSYSYSYRPNQLRDWPPVGLSPRAQALTIYIAAGLDRYDGLLSALGRHTTGKGCLYLPRLSDVDRSVLRELVRSGYEEFNGRTITPGRLQP